MYDIKEDKNEKIKNPSLNPSDGTTYPMELGSGSFSPDNLSIAIAL
jgi:hypothetical protein